MLQKWKTTVREKVSFGNETFWKETLIKQGHFLCLTILEKSDMILKSYMINLKKGTLKFLLNSCLDILPTQTNLLQWGKSASDLCKLCIQAGAQLQGRRQETTNHIFELTVPLETNIQNAKLKMNMYEDFITDITTKDVSVHPLKIG